MCYAVLLRNSKFSILGVEPDIWPSLWIFLLVLRALELAFGFLGRKSLPRMVAASLRAHVYTTLSPCLTLGAGFSLGPMVVLLSLTHLLPILHCCDGCCFVDNPYQWLGCFLSHLLSEASVFSSIPFSECSKMST